MNSKTFAKRPLLLVFAVILCCIGCGSSPGNSEDDFDVTTNLQGREDALKLLFTEAMYNTVTKESRNNPSCVESNRAALGLPDLPNGQWYYTYENLIAGMAKMEEFASEGADENTNKLEIAAFLANVAQETGGKVPGDAYGSPGCFIQEINKYGSQDYSRDCKLTGNCAAAGYFGRGPHQLSWDYNYKSFGEAMGVGSEYLNDPDILTKDHEIGIAGSIWFWGHEETNITWPANIPYKPSAHNVIVGKWTPTNFDTGCGRTTPGLGVITNIINGGLECGTRATAAGRANAANRMNFFLAIATAMGVQVPAGWADDCAGQKDFEECPSYQSPTSRCGATWSAAQAKCGTFCQTDADCSGVEKCFGRLDKKPCPE